MIYRLSEKISDCLLLHGVINEKDKDLLSYGFFIAISNFIYLMFVVCYGIFRNCLLSSIVFFFAFRVIRSFAGGFHASSEKKCFIITVLSLVVFFEFILLLETVDLHIYFYITIILSAITIISFAPIDNEKKKLNKKEKIKFIDIES